MSSQNGGKTVAIDQSLGIVLHNRMITSGSIGSIIILIIRVGLYLPSTKSSYAKTAWANGPFIEINLEHGFYCFYRRFI